jgi:NTE family protein
LDNAVYFEKLVGSVTRVARHSYYPGKEEAIELCLEEIQDLEHAGRITGEQQALLRELLLGEEDSCLVEGVIREREHREDSAGAARIGILCEGVGSQAAFCAGVLQGLLEHLDEEGEIVALGASSFATLSALLAWEGLLRCDWRRAVDQLERFWSDYTASSLLDALVNYSTQMVLRLREWTPLPGMGPCDMPALTHDQLRSLVERRVDLERSRALATCQGAPRLSIGLVGRHGEFEVVRGTEIQMETILAAAAPIHLPATQSSLQGEDPRLPDLPIRELIHAGPTELWLIQIRKAGRARAAGVPADVFELLERTSQQLLEQELRFLLTINRMLERGLLLDSEYHPIDVHRIIMEHDLDDSSRLDRSPGLINGLISYGKERGAQFLEKRGQDLSRRSSPRLER